MSEDGSSLWAFSLSVYANAAVQAECLDLQDHHGIDVNLLLFCAYVGAVHCAVLSDTEVRLAASIVGEWQNSIVKRLRPTLPQAVCHGPIADPLVGRDIARRRQGDRA
jgi:uncharacterized protein (TIGR02444 family)